MNRDEAKQAVKDGIIDYIKILAGNVPRLEASELGPEAQAQFGRGLLVAKDALDRCYAEVEKVFD